MNDPRQKIANQKSLSGINKLWNALTPLRHVGSFMQTGAHPDDERSSIIALLARRDGIRVTFTTATRGKGGQNAIGTEAGDDLGAFRTEELQAAATEIPMSIYWYSNQFGDPIDDFGFSTSVDEAESVWGKELTRERMVRIIRTEKPDILAPSMLDVDGQHGHHRAVTRATIEAYDLAADPNAFPDQISKEGLKPWQAKKLYLSAVSGRGQVYDDSEAPPDATIAINVGEWDDMAGATYQQIGEWSRAHHLTQGMGRWYEANENITHLHRLRCEYDIPLAEDNVFDGLVRSYGDMAKQFNGSLNRLLKNADKLTNEAIKAFPNHDQVFEKLNDLSDVLAKIDVEMSKQSDDLIHEHAHRIKLKRKQLGRALAEASGLQAEIIWDSEFISPNQTLKGNIYIYNTSDKKWSGIALDLIGSDISKKTKLNIDNLVVEAGKRAEIPVEVNVPANAPFHHPLTMKFEPFWIEERFSAVIGVPSKGGMAEKVIIPDEPVLIVPPVSLGWEASGIFFNHANDEKPVVATLLTEKMTEVEGDVTIGLDHPAGWRVMPPSYRIKQGEMPLNAKYDFTIMGPSGMDRISVSPYMQTAKRRIEENVLLMDYPHIRDTCKVVKNSLAVQPVDLEIPARLRVGYVSSGSDRVWYWLQRFGVTVEMLSVDDLKRSDLSVYDTILIGIRAFNAELASTSPFLRSYVENGGNLVTQYNRTDDSWDNNETPPRYIKIGTPSFRWRITDPNAKVTYLLPDHHLLNKPNKIGEADWAGWQQERGLYFIDETADNYQKLLSMADPGKEPLDGGLISGKIGEGWHHHCCLILHYQLEHQVPGAARLLANLITPPDQK